MASNYDLYSPIAVQAANAYGIPANLFLWQIGQESSWNPNAQNPSPGSTSSGIAGFIDSTANWLGINKSDPTSAIWGAAKYDSMLANSSKCNGDWLCALNSYGTTAGSPTLQAQAANAMNGGSGSSSGSSSNCGMNLFCWLDNMTGPVGNYGTDANGNPITKPPASNSSSCKITDLNCIFSQFAGRGSLIFLGLIFLAGAIYLYKN